VYIYIVYRILVGGSSSTLW